MADDGTDETTDTTDSDPTFSADPTVSDASPSESQDDRPTAGTDGETKSTSSTNDDPEERSVIVPSRVYKAVAVFSTLFAVMTVVGGFVLLDLATKQASVALSEVDPFLALAGLGLIVIGAVTYAYSTRFRAEGMGNAKDDTEERSNNG